MNNKTLFMTLFAYTFMATAAPLRCMNYEINTYENECALARKKINAITQTDNTQREIYNNVRTSIGQMVYQKRARMLQRHIEVCQQIKTKEPFAAAYRDDKGNRLSAVGLAIITNAPTAMLKCLLEEGASLQNVYIDAQGKSYSIEEFDKLLDAVLTR